MPKVDGSRPTRLQVHQVLKVRDWFVKLLPEFQEEKPSSQDVAAKATAELGFPVGYRTISDMRNEVGSWEKPKAERKDSRRSARTPEGTYKDRLRILARIVRYGFAQAEIPLPPQMEKNLDALCNALAVDYSDAIAMTAEGAVKKPPQENLQSPNGAAPAPEAVRKVVQQTFPPSRRL